MIWKKVHDACPASVTDWKEFRCTLFKFFDEFIFFSFLASADVVVGEKELSSGAAGTVAQMFSVAERGRGV
jgi:hypothetical protein